VLHPGRGVGVNGAGRKRSPTASASGCRHQVKQGQSLFHRLKPALGAVVEAGPLEDPQVEPPEEGVCPRTRSDRGGPPRRSRERGERSASCRANSRSAHCGEMLDPSSLFRAPNYRLAATAFPVGWTNIENRVWHQVEGDLETPACSVDRAHQNSESPPWPADVSATSPRRSHGGSVYQPRFDPPRRPSMASQSMHPANGNAVDPGCQAPTVRQESDLDSPHYRAPTRHLCGDDSFLITRRPPERIQNTDCRPAHMGRQLPARPHQRSRRWARTSSLFKSRSRTSQNLKPGTIGGILPFLTTEMVGGGCG